ncbi:MAG: diguanylate cyclase [Deltaproteobacteria bacterium]|nr:diguanylate cyclase [Deltaproteobacteria bacterium]
MPDQSRVLIVDDDLACLKILKKFLEKDGYQVVAADNGKQALTLAHAAKPDLIICDWMMPGLDGPRVCQAVKEDPCLRDTFFIFLTALDKGHIGQGISHGADDFITKPIDPQEVSAKVKAGLRLSLAHRDLFQQAQRDGLTGAYNRRYWENVLDQACRGKTRFTVAMADIDLFKEINDGWGHLTGDAFLRDLTRIWCTKLQEGEILARLGGDEFACLFCRSMRRLKLLRQEVEQELAVIFPDLPVGVSLGYAEFHPRQPATPQDLTAEADDRLYRDKRQRKKSRFRQTSSVLMRAG